VYILGCMLLIIANDSWAHGKPRLLEFVGTGRTSVRHSRDLGAIYDSDIVTPLALYTIPLLKKHIH
jgi:hypothetical protein